MITLNTAPDNILDSIFLKLNHDDLHETARVSKSWFWASIRRIKKLQITLEDNPLKSMAEFYNKHRPPIEEEIDLCDLFEHLVLDELVVDDNIEIITFLVNNGCSTAGLTIKSSKEEALMTVASLKKVTRLQYFEFHTSKGIDWLTFIAATFSSSVCGFDPNLTCKIESIKLNSSGWNTEDPVLQSVTKLSVWQMTIDFLRTMFDHCPNLEELHCSWAEITREWHHIFPANVKRIELQHMSLAYNVTSVNGSTDAGGYLLPYLCQDWESLDKFHFDDRSSGLTLYEAFPQQREEVFTCGFINQVMNLASPLFTSRKIRVECDGRKALQLKIPPAKSVKFSLAVKRDFKFSPKAVCLEPFEVECLDLFLRNDEPVAHDPFGPSSFEGFHGLTSLSLNRVKTFSIKMALDQCPSIKTLKLKELKASTIGNFPVESSYANVCELVLEDCKEPIDKVFQVFPCLSAFKHSLCREDEMRQTKDWLWRHLIAEDKMYGVVFESFTKIWYRVSDDLQVSLDEAQKLLKEHLYDESVSYLKGFELIPRAPKQRVIYNN